MSTKTETLNSRYRPHKHITAGELRAFGINDIAPDIPDGAWLPLSCKPRLMPDGWMSIGSLVLPYEWKFPDGC